MKQGRTLVELAAEIARQAEVKKDYVADTRAMTLHSNGTSRLALTDIGELAVNELAHGQIADHVKIPQTYYNRLRTEAPELLDANVNHWFADKPGRRMVRTLDGTARAFLSDRYRRLDNLELSEAVLPTLMEMPGLTVASCEVTETRMYIKVTTDRIQGEVKQGDVIQAGIVISNSEVGAGAVSVTPMTLRLVCLNGATHEDFGTRKNHVGRGVSDAGEGAYEMFADETLMADDKAFFLKVRDTVRGAMSDQTFQKILAGMKAATEISIGPDPVGAVETLANRYRLLETEKTFTLRHLIEGGDLSMYGMANAITRMAQDVPSYDRATELEALGGQLLTLPAVERRALMIGGGVNEQLSAIKRR